MAGACLTIGLLSFSGMLAIRPILPLAFGAFVLSVAYEGEIYLKNIKGSLKKLFKSNQLERQLSKACLLEHCFLHEPEDSRPQFFKDYERQLTLHHRFEHKRLDTVSRERKRHVEKTLGDMEKWFAEQLFSDKEGSTKYQKELRQWLNDNKRRKDKQLSLLEEFQAKRNSRYFIYQLLKAFCFAAGVFMSLGTTYLLSEAFAIIPWLAVLPAASLPILIVPMAAIAGVAYGLLVYNAMTDMIASEMVTTWFKKIGQDLDNPKTWRSGVAKAVVLSFMFLVTLTLSIFTAGTWWTVVKTTRPLFDWMSKIPAFVMLVLNPLILSLSAWAFNAENISETCEMAEPCIDAWLGEASEQGNINPVPHAIASEMSTETLLQRWNPFRMIIDYTFDPLRKLLFLGHLASIGATTDQVPGIPPIIPAVVGTGSEFVEDVHYFELSKHTPHEHKHDLLSLLKERLGTDSGHEHGNDLPTQSLSAVFSPLYLLAACWEFVFNRTSEKWSSWAAFKTAFGKAWTKETGSSDEVTIEFSGVDLCCEKPVKNLFDTKKRTKPNVFPVHAWQFEHAAYRIDRHKEKCLQGAWVGNDIAEQQIDKLGNLQKALHAKSDDATLLGLPSRIDTLISDHLKESDYNKHRFFLYEPSGKTDTRKFLEELSARVAVAR